MDKNKSNRTTFTQKDQCLVRKMSKIKKVHDKHIETEEEYEIEHDKAIFIHEQVGREYDFPGPWPDF